MSTDPLEDIKKLLPHCSPESRRELFELLREELPIHGLEASWNVTAEVVLEAIDRSSELTQRMFRGVLAEASCKVEVIDKLTGWEDVTPDGDHPFDFKVRRGDQAVTIQAKLQRKAKGIPWTADRAAGLADPDLYVVETQKTRGGKKGGENTRPYRFCEFDILAVSMEPATDDWTIFRFTLCRWLIPDAYDSSLIHKYQPVSLTPNDDWTNDLETCIEWLNSNVEKVICGGEDKKPRKAKRKGKRND